MPGGTRQTARIGIGRVKPQERVIVKPRVLASKDGITALGAAPAVVDVTHGTEPRAELFTAVRAPAVAVHILGNRTSLAVCAPAVLRKRLLRSKGTCAAMLVTNLTYVCELELSPVFGSVTRRVAPSRGSGSFKSMQSANELPPLPVINTSNVQPWPGCAPRVG